jgi:hypothetical protein
LREYSEAPQEVDVLSLRLPPKSTTKNRTTLLFSRQASYFRHPGVLVRHCHDNGLTTTTSGCNSFNCHLGVKITALLCLQNAAYYCYRPVYSVRNR